MEREPFRLDEPSTFIERLHDSCMHEPLYNIKTRVLLLMYEQAVTEYNIETDQRIIDLAKEIIQILYLELLERGIEFDYGEETKEGNETEQ